MSVHEVWPENGPTVSFDVELGDVYKSIDFDPYAYAALLSQNGVSDEDIRAGEIRFIVSRRIFQDENFEGLNQITYNGLYFNGKNLTYVFMPNIQGDAESLDVPVEYVANNTLVHECGHQIDDKGQGAAFNMLQRQRVTRFPQHMFRQLVLMPPEMVKAKTVETLLPLYAEQGINMAAAGISSVMAGIAALTVLEIPRVKNFMYRHSITEKIARKFQTEHPDEEILHVVENSAPAAFDDAGTAEDLPATAAESSAALLTWRGLKKRFAWELGNAVQALTD